MKKQLSDEQLDNLMRTLVSDAAVDDAMLNEIADSPTMWWGVQREIGQHSETRSPWPPIVKLWRWLMIGVPVAAAAVLVISFFVLRPGAPSENRANIDIPAKNDTVVSTSQPESTNEQTTVAVNSSNKENTTAKKNMTTARFVAPAKRIAIRPTSTTASSVKKAAEIKTEFIALSFARNPESGQIVRVRVPSSMMVTLGLVASVQEPSSLVDAEIVVGDDGQTHAIRFIRQ